MRLRTPLKRFLWITATLAVGGCAGMDILTSWEGVPADALLLSWGPPNQESKLSAGGRVISYSESANRFATRPDCTVMFQTNPDDVIVGTSRREENIGSCELLLIRRGKAYD